MRQSDLVNGFVMDKSTTGRGIKCLTRAEDLPLWPKKVRNLAQRSSFSAREMKELIESSMGEVETGFARAGGVGENMSRMNDAVRHVTDLVDEISTAASDQSQISHRSIRPSIRWTTLPSERCAGPTGFCSLTLPNEAGWSTQPTGKHFYALSLSGCMAPG